MFDMNMLMQLLRQRGQNPFQGGFGGLYGGGQGFAGHQPRQGIPLGVPGMGKPPSLPQIPKPPQARNPFAGFAMGQRGRQQLY